MAVVPRPCALLLLAATLAPAACGPLGTYGPAEDHSRFEGAALLADRTVLVSFSRLVYRPARGITAFPDGGIPRYLEDESVLAAYDIRSGSLRILRREANRRWASGQGRFGVGQVNGGLALVTRGGQVRLDLARNEYEDWIVDVPSGELRPLDWRVALLQRGRAMTELHLVDARGSLLFVTVPPGRESRRGDDPNAQLWIRTPAGEYLEVAWTSHYEGTRGDEVVFWIPETRRTRAFNLLTHETRDLPDYRLSPLEDPVEGVLVESGGRRVLLGRRGPAGWEYEPLPLDPGRL